VADPPTPTGPRDRGHDDHDPELIVALLDRDLAPEDRDRGEARIAACAACAALHADLRALATATAAVPVPSRPRDFALSPDVAAMLATSAAGEPGPLAGRQTGDMTDLRSMHPTHDRLLIATLVDRSPTDADRALAEAQLAACADCRLLYDDLVALSSATRSMRIPARPRDFTLTDADAERLRVRGWRRLLGAIGSPRDAFTRPLALGLTTLGIAGLLVATLPDVLPSGGATSLEAAAGAADTSTAQEANPELRTDIGDVPPAAAASGPAAAAAAPSAPASQAPLPAPTTESAEGSAAPDVLFEGGDASPVAGEPDDRGALDAYRNSISAPTGGGPSPMLVVAGLLVLAGLGLFGLRWAARRLGDG
jgi:hypothetical protein